MHFAIVSLHCEIQSRAICDIRTTF